MRILLLLSVILLAAWMGAAVGASTRSLTAEPAKTASVPAKKDDKKTAPAPAPTPAKKAEAGRTAAAGGGKPQAGAKPEQGQGARSGLGKFEFESPDKPQAKWNQGKRRSLLAEPAKTATAPAKKDDKKTAPAPAPAPAKKAEAGRTAASGGSKTQGKPEQGQGARSGLGKFEFESPDKPQAKWNQGKRRSLLAEPAKTAPAPAKKDDKKTAPAPAKKAEAGRTAAAGGSKTQGKPEQGQGARSGLGKFTFESPDKPEATWKSGRKRSLLAEPAKTASAPAKKDDKKSAPAPAKKAEAGRTAAAGGSKTQGKPEQGQGARSGLGKFTFESPDKPEATWKSGRK